MTSYPESIATIPPTSNIKRDGLKTFLKCYHDFEDQYSITSMQDFTFSKVKLDKGLLDWSKTWSASGLFSLSLKKRIWINFDLKWYILYLISDICIWCGDSTLFLHLFLLSAFLALSCQRLKYIIAMVWCASTVWNVSKNLLASFYQRMISLNMWGVPFYAMNAINF